MTTTRGTSTHKGTSKKKSTGRTFIIDYQKPGELPSKLSVKPNTGISDFIGNMSLDGYVVSINGSTNYVKDYVIKKGDVIRIGLKTKNNL